MSDETQSALEMDALDIAGCAWEDLQRAVLADSADSVVPRFATDPELETSFDSGWSGC
jgi:hypothetical protein